MLGLVLTACSDRQETAAPASVQAPKRTKLAPSIDTKSLEKLSSSVAAGGIATRYDAYFDGRQLKAILEQRLDAPAQGQGEYVFLGARLIEYAGNALPGPQRSDPGIIELKFDMQGRLLSARDRKDPARTIEQAQIDALRSRAELLRSHALAQRSVNAHQRTEEEHG